MPFGAGILVVMMHHHQILGMHILMHTKQLHLDAVWGKEGLFLCIFSHFGLAFMKVRLHKIVPWLGGEGKKRMCLCILHEKLHAAACVWVDVILVAPVSCLHLIQRHVHMYMLNSRC